MADNRFAEALMAFGDTVNNAFGGKQNIYGTYVEQQNKRLEAEQKRLEMERRANAEAAKALLTAQYRDNQLAQGQQRIGIAQDSARRTEATSLANTRSLRPIMPSDINRQPIGPNMTPEQALARTAARQQNRSLRESSVPGDLIGGVRTNFILDTSPSSKWSQEQRRSRMTNVSESNLDMNRYEKAGASFKDTDAKEIERLQKTYNTSIDNLLKDGKVYKEGDTYNVRSGAVYSSYIKGSEDTPMTGDTAGRYAFAKEAVRNTDLAESLLFKDGKYNQNLIDRAAMGAKYIRDADVQNLKRWVESALVARGLIQSGTVLKDSEWVRLSKGYGIDIFTAGESARKALSEQRQFMNEFMDAVKPSRGRAGKAAPSDGLSDDDAYALYLKTVGGA